MKNHMVKANLDYINGVYDERFDLLLISFQKPRITKAISLISKKKKNENERIIDTFTDLVKKIRMLLDTWAHY